MSTKALRAADHFLLSRYFDYQQVAYHKTVAAFELVLKDVLRALLDAKLVECSATSITRDIENGGWYSFDDQHILQKLAEIREEADDTLVLKLDSILERRPPKLIWSREFLGQRTEASRERLSIQRRILRTTMDKAAAEFGIDAKLWFVWSQKGLELTKIGGHVPVSQAMQPGEDEYDKYDQSLRMIDTSTGVVTPIVEMTESLMSILSDYALYALRLYVLLPTGLESTRSDIEVFVRQEMNNNE